MQHALVVACIGSSPCCEVKLANVSHGLHLSAVNKTWFANKFFDCSFPYFQRHVLANQRVDWQRRNGGQDPFSTLPSSPTLRLLHRVFFSGLARGHGTGLAYSKRTSSKSLRNALRLMETFRCWPFRLLQIALEVHDIDGRLAATIRILTSEPAAFDEVCWQPLLTSEVKGYVMVVPKALKMFLVFAKRRPKKAPSADDGSAGGRGAEAPSVTGSLLEGGEQAGGSHLPHVVGGSKGDSGAYEETIPSSCCSCVSADR